jgi:hypothetical protein
LKELQDERPDTAPIVREELVPVGKVEAFKRNNGLA